ncbi:hypothetical protein GTR02_18600, partial [Kineococcus sp. R8]|uniref:hypothetical protein n=1 Tax=Kineococcus siccus TaxID=2696567 RepID=UPI001412EC63
MGIDLGKDREGGQPPAAREGAQLPAVRSGGRLEPHDADPWRRDQRRGRDRDRHRGKELSPRELEDRELEKLDIDESRLTPVGVVLPRVGFVSDAVCQGVRLGWMGLWIALYAVGAWFVALPVMFAWIGANAAYESHTKEQRRRRKREMRALQVEAAGGPPAQLGPARTRA